MKDIKWGIVVVAISSLSSIRALPCYEDVRLANNFSSPMSLTVTSTISYLLLFLLLLCREI
jgi:hypothetical protein